MSAVHPAEERAPRADGLIQYRIVCQQVNVQSLEEVIKHFLKLATEKAESAQAAAAASANDATLA